MVTEHDFRAILATQGTIWSINWKVYFAMLNMSEAFDGIKCPKLLEDLTKVVNYNELHLIKLSLQLKFVNIVESSRVANLTEIQENHKEFV